MTDKIMRAGLIAFIFIALTGCSCEHEYDQGKVTKRASCDREGEMTYTCNKCGEQKTETIPMEEHSYRSSITKEATYNEEGEITYICRKCRDSYTEVIPMRKAEVIVEVIGKNNLEEDYAEGRYSPRVEFDFEITNKSEDDIKGIQGIITISDASGNEFVSEECDFTGIVFEANKTISVGGIGIDINEFIERQVELYNADFSDLSFEYEIKDIVYGSVADIDEKESQEQSQDLTKMPKVVIDVIDKDSLPENFMAGRYTPRVEFTFEVHNNTEKDIKGVQGIMVIKDLFDEEIKKSSVDFTGQTIAAGESAVFSGKGFEVYAWEDDNVKLYNENYDDLKFECYVTTIVYTDGTSE